MPLSWNGKLDTGGNGGYGRGFALPVDFMVPAIHRGYAVAGTDMGHPITVGYDASWANGKPTKIIDWAYQANHVTAGVAKTIIQTFYGNGPKLSYFTCCSDGGHEALMTAQRFPDDYDGIIGGALKQLVPTVRRAFGKGPHQQRSTRSKFPRPQCGHRRLRQVDGLVDG
jgi:feruloyl esterase